MTKTKSILTKVFMISDIVNTYVDLTRRRRGIKSTVVALLACTIVLVVLVASLAISPLSATRTLTSTSTSTQTLTLRTNYTTTTTSYQTETVVSQTNFSTTETRTATETTTATVSTWYGLVYLGAAPGCGISYGVMNYSAPCFSSSGGYLFNCAAAAASSKGCTQQIDITGTSNQNFTITIWFPLTSGSGEESWQNCRYTQSLPTPPGPQTSFAFCIPVNSTSFLVAEQAHPRVPV